RSLFCIPLKPALLFYIKIITKYASFNDGIKSSLLSLCINLRIPEMARPGLINLRLLAENLILEQAQPPFSATALSPKNR
ncbi:TPA: hypothetical protein ACLGZT_003232, partial [Salmonella enterica]